MALTLPFGVTEVQFLGESTNAHWLVRRGGEELVIRRFRRARSLASAQYEAALCNRLHALDPRVPRVLEVDEVDGVAWMLMTRCLGEPGTYANDDPRRRGRQLAELHTHMATMTDLGPREGRALPDTVLASETLDAALAYFAALRPDEGRVLQWHVARARARFAEHDLASLPRSIVHGDFAPWNLLFTDGALTGIVDFDLAHLSYRVTDFALSWRGKYDDVIRGYDDVLPLDDNERALLGPIRWAWLLLFVEDAIDEFRAGHQPSLDFDWVVQQLLRRSPLMGPDATPYAPR